MCVRVYVCSGLYSCLPLDFSVYQYECVYTCMCEWVHAVRLRSCLCPFLIFSMCVCVCTWGLGGVFAPDEEVDGAARVLLEEEGKEAEEEDVGWD